MDAQFEELELRSLFTGEWDDKDAVCQIQSGEGGTDAQDWADTLLRMYKRWADTKGFDFEVISINEGQEAGITSAEFIVRGAGRTACSSPSTVSIVWCASRRSTRNPSAKPPSHR